MENHDKEVEVTNEEQNNGTSSEEKNTEQLSEVEELEIQLKEKNNDYLRLYAEFDNFRKRTAKEKIDLVKVASKGVILDFLPVLDDINRAHVTIDASNDIAAVKDGVDLILDKLMKVLKKQGLEEMNVIGEDFNSDFHEAVTDIPAANEDMIGKVVDEVEKGYKLNDKIVRYPKVVVGK